MDVIPLKPSDRRSAARVFARAFFNYPIIVSHWPDPARRSRYLEWYGGCAINYALRYGKAYTTSGIAGIALWLPPGETRFTPWRCIRAGYFRAPLFIGLRRSLALAVYHDDAVGVQQAHAEIVPGPHWYLWLLAVDPEHQHKGIGSRLMQPALQLADRQQLPCYLETNDQENIPFYRKHGFGLVRTLQVPGSDLRFWTFLRQPRIPF